jgi:hypothetical protein
LWTQKYNLSKQVNARSMRMGIAVVLNLSEGETVRKALGKTY